MRKDECGWCGKDFWPHPFTKLELRAFREALLIADNGYKPVICDDCHETVMKSAPKHINPPKFIMNAV